MTVQTQAPRQTTGQTVRPTRPQVAQLPPLESGDRLTRHEFERRYQAMPQVKKAELIEGVVNMPSPVRFASHSDPHSQVVGWLTVYRAATPAVSVGDNATVRLDAYNEVQPDALLRLEAAAGGHSRISSDDYVEGPPELIVEIAASSASHDLHDKLRVYCRNGVQEYLVWQIYGQRLDWFQLHAERGEYVPLLPDAEGVIHSSIFPGLNLAVNALLDGDLAQVLAKVQQGCASPEHEAFVAALKQQMSDD